MNALAIVLLASAVPRFDRPPSPIALEGPARPTAYLEASGRRAAFLGREDGSFEAWVYPLKILRGFELAFEVEDYASPIPGASLATRVEVRPEASTIRYVHSSFTADATWLVPLEEPGGLVLLDVDASAPLTIYARFHTEMRLMWPAGLGGQYSYWDRELRAYVITESTRRHAAIVGSPFASDPPEQPAHNLPDAPTEMKIPISLETAASGLVPIAIASSDEGLEAARATYRRLLDETESLYRSTAAHYQRLRDEMTRIDSPDDELESRARVGKGRARQGLRMQPAARLRAHRRARSVRAFRAAGVRLVLRRRRLHQQLGDDRLRRLRDGAREPAVSIAAPARRRKDDARALPGGGLHPVVRGVSVRLLPCGYDAALHPCGLGLRPRERGCRVRPRDLAFAPEGVRVLRFD